ncbi:MAG TPA: glycosyltransferase family 9 protein [Candidatus Limnocylindrales bacterium]
MRPRPVGGRLTVLEADERPLWGRSPAEAFVPPGLATGSADGWSSFERVLCVRLDAIGDVLMTTPAFRALKAARPDRRLTLLTSTAGAAAGRLVPEIDEVVVYDPPWMKATTERDDVEVDRAMVATLAAGHYDAAVVFTVHDQPALPAALLTYLAGIPRRLAHSRDKPYRLLTEWVAEPEPDAPLRHEVRRQLDLVAAVGVGAADEHLSVRVPAEASRAIRDRLAGLGVAPRTPWLLVHPGSTAPSRTYPGEAWAAAARELGEHTSWPIVWSGGPNERSFVNLVRDASGVGTSIAGELTFAELTALVAVAPLLVTNNTGPAHIAAAVGTPVVDVYAQTNAQHGPWQVPNRVLFADVPCRGCHRSVCPMGHHRCLRDVPPEAVTEAVLDLAAEVGLIDLVAGRSHEARRAVV